MRILTFSKYNEHTNPIFASLKLLKIDDLMQFQILKFIFQFYEKKLPSNLGDLFQINASIHCYSTRQSQSLHIPKVNTSHYGISSLKYKGPFIWNNFVQNNDLLDNLSSLFSFKKMLKENFINKYLSLTSD